jgi:protein phosphatase
MTIRAFGTSDVGLVRERNEDSFLVDDAHSVFAVADGIGGMPGGDTASQSAIAAVRDAIARAAGTPLSHEAIGKLVESAHAAVQTAGRDFGPDGIGTTMTLVHIGDGRARLAHVGDSFALLVRDGKCRALTREHNVENERTDSFSVAPYPPAYRYALTRSLGQPGPVEVELIEAELRAGDCLVLATDGLTDLVEPLQIASVCAAHAEPSAVARTLIEHACIGGGHDNITVIVVRIDSI